MKKNKLIIRKKTSKPFRNKIIITNRLYIGESVSSFVDAISNPRFKEEAFRAIEDKRPRSYELHAQNDEVTLHFSIEWKGNKI